MTPERKQLWLDALAVQNERDALLIQVRDLTGERDKWKLQAMDADLECMGLRNQIAERGEQLAESGSSKETGNNEAEEICGRVYVDYPITCQKLPMHSEACDNVADLRQENVRLRDTAERLERELAKLKPPPPKTVVFTNSCNRHSDCAAATERFKSMNGGRAPGFNFHCHTEDCEDCFGC